MLIKEGWCAKEEGGALLCNGEFVQPFIRRPFAPGGAGMLVLDKLVRWGDCRSS